MGQGASPPSTGTPPHLSLCNRGRDGTHALDRDHRHRLTSMTDTFPKQDTGWGWGAQRSQLTQDSPLLLPG